jgi:hypothetical protein
MQWRRTGGVDVSSTHSLTSALDGGEWSASRPGRFIPRERAPFTHWIGGWVGLRAGLDAVAKRKIPSPRRELNPRTPILRSVAQRYTDWAITALICTYAVTVLSRTLLEKLAVAQLFKNLPVFHGTWKFIAEGTTDCHWTLFWASLIHCLPSYTVSLRYILICPHLRLGLKIFD